MVTFVFTLSVGCGSKLTLLVKIDNGTCPLYSPRGRKRLSAATRWTTPYLTFIEPVASILVSSKM